MKKISIEKLELLDDGNKSFIAGFCSGVSVVRFGAMVRLFALNPIVGGAMTAVVSECIAYGIYSNLS